MSKELKILTPRIYEHSDFFHDAVDFAREHSLNTNELCLELSHYLVDNFEKIWKVEKPRVYKKLADLEAKLAELQQCSLKASAKHNLEMQNAQICIKQLKQQLAKKEQDKISFAIDELVKVKNFVNYRHFDFVPDGLIERFEVEKKIDNQIEELKKEMK